MKGLLSTSIRDIIAFMDRTLHLVDLENLCGGVVTSKAVHAELGRYEALAGVARGDHVVVALSYRNARAIAGDSTLTRFRWVCGRGIDGADRALADAVDLGTLGNMYSCLALGSGDGGFSPLVGAAGRFVRTLVVSHADRLSKALVLAATEVRVYGPGQAMAA